MTIMMTKVRVTMMMVMMMMMHACLAMFFRGAHNSEARRQGVTLWRLVVTLVMMMTPEARRLVGLGVECWVVPHKIKKWKKHKTKKNERHGKHEDIKNEKK